MELGAFRSALDAWLDEHDAELTPTPGAAESLDDQMAHLALVKRLTYEAGWMRWGWPDTGRRARAGPRCCAPTWARRSPRGTWSSRASTR